MRKSTISIPGTLLTACAGLLWFDLTYSNEPSASDAQVPSEAVQTRENADLMTEATFRPPALGRFTETLKRPVFSPTRRPPEVKVVAAKTIQTIPLDLILKGVVFSPQERIAIVVPGSQARGSKILRLPEGATYQGWTLEEIAPKEAIFRQGNSEEHLKLQFGEHPNSGKKRRPRRRKAGSQG